MGEKMKNAPIYFAIAQVQYNPILSLDSYLAEMQEKFRKAGYPGYKTSVSMAFNLAPLVEGEGSPQQIPPVQRASRYIFSNLEENSAFILEQNRLSFQATDYDTFETFSLSLLKGLEFLHQVVRLSFIERIGIRYLDAVLPNKNETFTQYLIPEVLGLYEKFDGNTTHSFSESMKQKNAVSLVSRTIVRNGPLGFPPDLQPIGIQVDKRFAAINGPHAIIDTDAFYAVRETFNLDKVKEQLTILHDDIIEAFYAVITKHAIDVWK